MASEVNVASVRFPVGSFLPSQLCRQANVLDFDWLDQTKPIRKLSKKVVKVMSSGVNSMARCVVKCPVN